MSASTPHAELLDRICGVILGTAVGDALGLPREGLSRRRAALIFGDGPLQHRLVFDRGMVSDDTEHTCLVGQALLDSSDAEEFARALAWRLRWWLLGLPAGVGLGTARAIVKLWCGFPPLHSGVWSAGNGPAMRAALLGICLAGESQRIRQYVRASTRMTHADPRAETGALLVALAAAHGAASSVGQFNRAGYLDCFHEVIPEADDELREICDAMKSHIERGASPREFAVWLDLEAGVTGYVYDTVPVALYCWLHWSGDFRPAVEDAIKLGGDADSMGAIVGALCGATVGARAIPGEWLDGLAEWPRSQRWMRELASRLAERFAAPAADRPASSVPFFWPGQVARNVIFLGIVLFHGFRRLLPPY